MLEIVTASSKTVRINTNLVEAIDYRDGTVAEATRVLICMASGQHYVVMRDAYEKEYKSHIEGKL